MPNSTYKNIRVDNIDYYGKHMMLTGVNCNSQLLDIDTMSAFLKKLADDIDMERYGEPVVARFGEGIQTGLSAVQLITTSALTVHTNDDARDLYLDVFSCKWFDEQTVIDAVNEQYMPASFNYQVVLRK